MEPRQYSLQLLWVVVILNVVIAASETLETTAPLLLQETPPPSMGFAWSAWGTWSPCSKSCGGGVAVQRRQCLPRTRTTIPEGTLPPPVITVRVTRDTKDDCAGVVRRYHECNTLPCAGETRDMRSEQCGAFDRRPFRGRFYTWVPYIDGNSPCTLNCRPLGHQFYASLSLVTDGTPCTKPGYRAICVQGSCKAVGKEAVLASNYEEMRCGRRLVSGLFSRPRLPLGYSFVTTVPRGACYLNVSQIIANDNYIALKITNGSYIINGEFAVSSPGTYDAAGARFVYSRNAGLDTVFAIGPIHFPIDIMALNTQPNPSLKYQYFTESLPGEIDEPATKSDPTTVHTKHSRRHHSFEAFPRLGLSKNNDVLGISNTDSDDNYQKNIVKGRRYVWKILSYTTCTRSCGGGIQVGKYRCVEESSNDSDREVASVHCSGSPPAGRRRRCGNTPCPPRWRAATWTTCPKCGPATRTRIVGCVQDHSRGITKISDQKCPPPKPHNLEQCNIPDCSVLNEANQSERRNKRPREQTENFHDGPVYSVAVNNTDFDIGPEYSISATAGWLFTDWSECVGWCVGGGKQTRGVRCADPSGCPWKAPDSYRSCTPSLSCEPHVGQWFTGEWSSCSSKCGGKQVRGVLCIGGSGRHLRDSACKDKKPEDKRNCDGDCKPSWYYSDWSQCIGNCTVGTGIQRRTVWCAKKDDASEESECSGAKPQAHRACDLKCTSVTISTLPPGLTVESLKSGTDMTTQKSTTISTTTTTQTTTESQPKDCEDKLTNCALAVQARLCHYNYYVNNCCYSCKGR